LIVLKLELHQVTAMVFPEEVSTITIALPKERVNVDKDGPYVGFFALDATVEPHRFFVVGVSGRIYMVKLQLVTSGGDDQIFVTHKPPAAKGLPLTPAGVIRALQSGKGREQWSPAEFPLPTIPDPRVALVDPQRYTLGPYQALVVTVVNQQDETVYLDERVGHPEGAAPPDLPLIRLDTWIWPPKRTLKALALTRELVVLEQVVVLPPRGRLTLYVVFEERS
jgi:hypothetical protein